MDHTNHVDNFISYLDSFQRCSADLKSKIRQNTSYKNLNEGEVFITKGGYDKVIGFLSEGIMRIYDVDKEGQEWNKSILNYQTILLGNAAPDQPAIHHIAAISSCHIITLPVSFVEAAMLHFNELRMIKDSILSRIYQMKSERESDLLLLTTKERYLKLKDHLGSDVKRIPQYHLASFLGVTPIQLSRIRGSLPA